MLKQHKTVSVNEASLMLFGIAYIPFLLSTLIEVSGLEGGRLLLWLVFVGAYSTDTFAYFSGVFFGKHKLCPEISPKKTVEGSVGGTLGCVVMLIIYGVLLEKTFGQTINYPKLAILGVLVAIISQIGDLTASIIKRKYGVKDYGSIFPGHGGILDRLDSIITTAPLVYIYILTVGI
jgi:phosphatidate cytidylyltransferase